MADYLNLAGRFHSTASDNVALESQEILDNTLNKKQNVINTKVYNTAASIGYTECSTPGETAAKVVLLSNFDINALNGGNIKIKFNEANTTDSDVTLKIKATSSDSSAEDKLLYYSGQPVSNTNTWKAGETVDIYYDGTYYQANNVRGGVVELKDTLATPASASHEEGVTEYVVSSLKGTSTDSIDTLTLYGLKANIDDIRSATATTGMTLAGNSSNFSKFTVSTDELAVVGTCSTSATMTVTGTGISGTTTKTGTTCNWTANVSPNNAAVSLTYSIAYDRGSVRNRSLTVYYVYKISYGALAEYDASQLTEYNTATQDCHMPYSMNLDSTERKIYFRIPKTFMNTISLVRLYSDGNYSIVAGSFDSDLETTTHRVWVSTDTYTVTTAGARSFIVS